MYVGFLVLIPPPHPPLTPKPLRAQVLAGYGFCNVPSSPGAHSVDIVTWVPSGSLNERLSGFFLGTKPQLEDPGIVSNTAPGEGRFGLKCESSGIVYVHFEVLLTNMQRFGVLT
jgi:B9 domain-containing protein 2